MLTARIHRFHSGPAILDYRRIDPGELSDHHAILVVPDTDRINDDLVRVYP